MTLIIPIEPQNWWHINRTRWRNWVETCFFCNLYWGHREPRL